MKTTSMSKGATPENYVRELRLRSPVSSQVYRELSAELRGAVQNG
jgi:hypothetical protein